MLEGLEIVVAVGELLKKGLWDVLFLAEKPAHGVGCRLVLGEPVDFQAVTGVEDKALADALLFMELSL